MRTRIKLDTLDTVSNSRDSCCITLVPRPSQLSMLYAEMWWFSRCNIESCYLLHCILLHTCSYMYVLYFVTMYVLLVDLYTTQCRYWLNNVHGIPAICHLLLLPCPPTCNRILIMSILLSCDSYTHTDTHTGIQGKVRHTPDTHDILY